MEEDVKKRLMDEILREAVHYLPAEGGFLEVRLRFVTKEEFEEQSRRRVQAGALKVEPVPGGDFQYRVGSHYGKKWYRVNLLTRRCTCPEFKNHPSVDRFQCKHIIAAINYLRLPEIRQSLLG